MREQGVIVVSIYICIYFLEPIGPAALPRARMREQGVIVVSIYIYISGLFFGTNRAC